MSENVKNTFSFDKAIEAARVECADAKGQNRIYKSLLSTEEKCDDYSVDTFFKKTEPAIKEETTKKKHIKLREVQFLCGPKVSKGKRQKRPKKRILSKLVLRPNSHEEGAKSPNIFTKNTQRLSQLSKSLISSSTSNCFSAGTIFCCNHFSNSDLKQGNCRFWEQIKSKVGEN